MDATEKLRLALELHDDTMDLIELSTKWLNDATQWGEDERLGPMWEAIYARRNALDAVKA